MSVVGIPVFGTVCVGSNVVATVSMSLGWRIVAEKTGMINDELTGP